MANTRQTSPLGSPSSGEGIDARPPAALRAIISDDYRRLNRNRMIVLSIFGGMCAAVLGMASMMHPGHPGRHSQLAGLIIGLQALSGLVLVSTAFGWPSLGRAGILRILVALGLFGTALLVPLIDPSLPWVQAGLGAGLDCLVHGAIYALTLSAVVVVVAGRLLRRHAPVSLMLGLGTAQIVWGPLHLMCRHNDAAHIMIWHALMPPTALLVAWWVHRMWRKALSATSRP